MLSERAYSDAATVTELALEVQRLKQLIHVQEAQQGNNMSGATADLERLRSTTYLDGTPYGDLQPRTDQTIHYANGDKYKGDTLGNLKHGNGRLTCANGDVYTGQWRYGKRDGHGHAEFQRAAVLSEAEQPMPVCYDGCWKDDKTSGEGTCTYADGAVYTGDWEQDQRCGWGKHVFANQDWYEGEWAADTMQGDGRLTITTGACYECSWQNGQPQKGKWHSADGRIEYDGQFKGMLWHGFGTVHESGVRKYRGQWKDGVEHGHGQCSTADGVTYDGQWKQGVRCGEGKMSEMNGYQYSGTWLDDQPHGQGMCKFSDGSKYVGCWQQGKRNGQGRCLYACGDQYEGQWEEDVRHGKGGCIYASGDKYKGDWKADKRHGQGVCVFADGTRFKGAWEEDAWVQSAADGARSRAAGPGLARALAGQAASFVIQGYDELKNKRLSGGDDFRVHLIGPGGVATHASIADKEDGTYMVSYTCTAAGVHDLHILIGDEKRVANWPHVVRVLAGKPVVCKSPEAGPACMHSTTGQQVVFFVKLPARDCGALAGFAEVSVSAGDEERVAASPYTVRVLAGKPVVRKSTVAGAGRMHSTTGQQAEFFVEGRDQFGNRCDGSLAEQLPLSVDLSCKPFHCTVLIIPTDDGRYHCTYVPDRPGFYRLEVTSLGVQLSGSPFSVQVAQSVNSPETSSGHGHKSDAIQKSTTIEEMCHPLVDTVKAWSDIAAAQYGEEGDLTGWSSDDNGPESSESHYSQAHPDVPVVENLEDIWLIGKLQKERQANAQAQERQQQLQRYKQASQGSSKSNRN